MQKIENYDFSGKRTIIRVDFNVPLNSENEITDATRINVAIPTIKKVLEQGAVILMSHKGRPKGKYVEKESLKHIIKYVSEKLQKDIIFADNCIGEEAIKLASNLQKGEVLLLENLRFHAEEKKGDYEFAKKLSKLADVYVNDAFGAVHRAHASISTITQFFPNDKMFGYIIENEIKNIDKVVRNIKKPFTAIVGGAKVSSKISIIENLLLKVDNLIIGGGMTYTFIKAKGGNIGNSLLEADKFELVERIFKLAKDNNVNLYLPTDSVNADKFDNSANIQLSKIDDIPDNWLGLDIGDESIKNFSEIILNSATILWNGPVGVFEMDNFAKGTKEIAKTIAEATKNGAYSLVGGGDTVAALTKFNLFDKISHVSTGGGALLEYIEGKELPGLKAMKIK